MSDDRSRKDSCASLSYTLQITSLKHCNYPLHCREINNHDIQIVPPTYSLQGRRNRGHRGQGPQLTAGSGK